MFKKILWASLLSFLILNSYYARGQVIPRSLKLETTQKTEETKKEDKKECPECPPQKKPIFGTNPLCQKKYETNDRAAYCIDFGTAHLLKAMNDKIEIHPWKDYTEKKKEACPGKEVCTVVPRSVVEKIEREGLEKFIDDVLGKQYEIKFGEFQKIKDEYNQAVDELKTKFENLKACYKQLSEKKIELPKIENLEDFDKIQEIEAIGLTECLNQIKEYNDALKKVKDKEGEKKEFYKEITKTVEQRIEEANKKSKKDLQATDLEILLNFGYNNYYISNFYISGEFGLHEKIKDWLFLGPYLEGVFTLPKDNQQEEHPTSGIRVERKTSKQKYLGFGGKLTFKADLGKVHLLPYLKAGLDWIKEKTKATSFYQEKENNKMEDSKNHFPLSFGGGVGIQAEGHPLYFGVGCTYNPETEFTCTGNFGYRF